MPHTQYLVHYTLVQERGGAPVLLHRQVWPMSDLPPQVAGALRSSLPYKRNSWEFNCGDAGESARARCADHTIQHYNVLYFTIFGYTIAYYMVYYSVSYYTIPYRTYYARAGRVDLVGYVGPQSHPKYYTSEVQCCSIVRTWGMLGTAAPNTSLWG